MHVELTFFEWLTLYFWPIWGYRGIVNRSKTCPKESMMLLWSLNFVAWKLYEPISNLLFWVINPLFLTLLGYRRIVIPSTTFPEESLTFLWSLNFVAWKLCECIETDRDRDRDRQTILFIDIDIYIIISLIFDDAHNCERSHPYIINVSVY